MPNAFESGTQKVIPAVLIYVKFKGQILMIHRIKKAQDYHAGKWNGLGGKLEVGESPRDAAVRELVEESGICLKPEQLKLLGVLQFPSFKRKVPPQITEDWWVTVFVAHLSELPTLTPCGEGELHWIEESRVLELSLWAGDRYFLPHVITETPFMGTLWYEGEKISKHELHLLGC